MKKHDISFFFPAFNDSGTIVEMVEEGREVLSEVADNYEILIINDGSLDDTGEVADKVAKKYPEVRVIHHRYNLGYGAALKTGFGESKYDVIFYTDGDHQFDIKELKKFVPYIDSHDLVAGYRTRRAYDNEKMRLFTSTLYNYFIKFVFNLKFRDLDCAFKLMRKDVVKNFKTFVNNAFICAVIFYEAKEAKKRIIQVPVSHYERKYGHSSSFSLIFILKSVVELFEVVWDTKYKEKFYAFRQRKMVAAIKKEERREKKEERRIEEE